MSSNAKDTLTTWQCNKGSLLLLLFTLVNSAQCKWARQEIFEVSDPDIQKEKIVRALYIWSLESRQSIVLLLLGDGSCRKIEVIESEHELT